MTSSYSRGMAKATALTRLGKLQDATAMIQALLHGTTPPDSPAPVGLHADGLTIEGTATRLDPFAPSPPPPKRRAKAATSPLAETLRRISAGGMPARDPLSGVRDALPDGAQFLALTHTAPEGSRGYRLYIPANRPQGQMPLIVMLHGCTQTPEDFATGTGMNALAEEFGCIIAYPAQPLGANMQKCWNWYRPEDQVRGQGEPALIAGMTRAIQAAHPVDAARIYVAGLSAGGAAAVVIAAAYPEIYAAVGVHSGLPRGGAHDVPSAFAAMRAGTDGTPHPTVVPTIVFHGSGDSTVHPSNGTAVMSQALHAMTGLKSSTRQAVSDGGRGYRITAHNDASGRSLAEHWQIDGAGHAWAGGQAAGSYTDPAGPDASRQMLRFFLQHART